MSDEAPVPLAEQPKIANAIAAVEECITRREAARNRVHQDTEGRITDAFADTIAALEFALATLQQHERAMAVVEAARNLQALRYGEVDKETLDQFKALDALDIALAALDDAASAAGDTGL